MKTNEIYDKCFYIIGWIGIGALTVLWIIWKAGFFSGLTIPPCTLHSITGYYLSLIHILQACKADGMDVYLLEYTTDHKLIHRIKKYCRKKKYDYYIADSLELGI